MSVISEGTYRITNKFAGLALSLSPDDNTSVIAQYVDEGANNQLVRIACPFNSFC
jgi:hypothetical protein